MKEIREYYKMKSKIGKLVKIDVKNMMNKEFNFRRQVLKHAYSITIEMLTGDDS